MPVHPNLEGKTPWIYSTEFIDTDKDKKLRQMTEKSKSWTSKVSSTLKKKTNYKSPFQSTILLQEEIREKKRNGTFSLDKPLIVSSQSQALFEKVNDPPTFKNPLAQEKVRFVSSFEHSGVWEKNKIDGR